VVEQKSGGLTLLGFWRFSLDLPGSKPVKKSDDDRCLLKSGTEWATIQDFVRSPSETGVIARS
jgi:hypothetical protein